MDKIKNLTLIELIRKSQKNKDLLTPIFNPNNECFECLFISCLTLENACKYKNVDVSSIINNLVQ